MTVRRRSMLFYGGSSMDGGTGTGSRVTDEWLVEEYEGSGEQRDNDDDVTLPRAVTFSIAKDTMATTRSARRQIVADQSVFIDGVLTNGLLAMNAGGVASSADDDVTSVSVEMFPGAGLGADSDDDSAESGFSEQDGPALDS